MPLPTLDALVGNTLLVKLRRLPGAASSTVNHGPIGDPDDRYRPTGSFDGEAPGRDL